MAPTIKPWYNVVTPREDLREGKPLDASEFAVHLDHVRDGKAPKVYQDPIAFFERTYLTKTLTDLGQQVVRRLNGIAVETSAVFNLSTQFGGGKTHALTMLFHLASGGAAVPEWKGVARGLLQPAGVSGVPLSATAVFVGTEFDAVTGRGGRDDTPLRKTPWGEIAYQLGGMAGFEVVAEHDRLATAPGGDVIQAFLPKDRGTLILLDELMNFVSRYRKSGLGAQFYNFLHNLSEVARSRPNVVLAVSIPASELEMSAEDQQDFDRFKKMLDRLGKAMVMSAEDESSEIIRRRLFEWTAVPDDARGALDAFSEWVKANRNHLPAWFSADQARDAFKASYPFHPAVISVFRRKWQGLPRFQQTRGMLRLLALWVSAAFQEDFRRAHKDSLITLGTAPLHDPSFRSAMFEQLGEQRLEAAVTTDIAGTDSAHAKRLDDEATPDIKKQRLHRKVATTVFFESNGGQTRLDATAPEVRLAMGEPGVEIASIDQAIEALADVCYYMAAQGGRYRFSFHPNLNKLLADKIAGVTAQAAADRAKAEVHKVFQAGEPQVTRLFFPTRSNLIPDRAALTLVITDPIESSREAAFLALLWRMTQERGDSARVYKTGLFWCGAEDGGTVVREARKLLAWKEIEAETSKVEEATAAGRHKLDESQTKQLRESVKRAEADLRESVWRTYRFVYYLGENNQALEELDLGQVNSSAASSLASLVVSRLKEKDLVSESPAPRFAVRFWPPALREWSTRGFRDAFFASPKFPRLLNPDAVKDVIRRGVEAELFAYAGALVGGVREPFHFGGTLAVEVEIADDLFLLSKEDAMAYRDGRNARPETSAKDGPTPTEAGPVATATQLPVAVPAVRSSGGHQLPLGGAEADSVPGFTWSGPVPVQKWMNFYTKVLTPYATSAGLRVTISVEVAPEAGVTQSKLDNTRNALVELGLPDGIVRLPTTTKK